MKLHQLLQFKPTEDNVSALLLSYGLRLIGYSLTDNGIENCTILAQTTTGNHVLRVYRQDYKKDAEILRELDFIAYLNDNDVPVAVPMPTLSGDRIARLEEDGQTWQAILMPHMAGEHAEHYTDGLLDSLASVQARMHILAASYSSVHDDLGTITEIRANNFIKLIQDRQSLSPSRQAFVTRAETYIVTLDGSLPVGLCHMDFDTDNVLSENDAITAVLDFDDLTRAPFVLCLANTLWDIAYDLDISGITPYLQSYERLRLLSELEKRYIFPIMLARHYAIGCKMIVETQMNEEYLAHYLELEAALSDADS